MPPTMPMTSRRSFSLVVLGLALASASLQAATPAPPSEGALRQDLQAARWPADIVRASERYVAGYPQGPSAAAARSMLDLARQSTRALDRNVRLYRGDFLLEGGAPVVGEDVRKAALADREAALRVAHMIRDRENGVDFDVNRYVGWLQFAAALGNGPASYELAVHYRKADQPALAAPYELRAEELGFKAPPSLDNVRK
jgi:TPR repeat protein